MKHLSIKLKVTLWYTLMNLGMVILLLGAITIGSRHFLTAQVKANLIETVYEASDKMEYEEGELVFKNSLNRLNPNVRLRVYTEEGQGVYGQLPEGFEEELIFMDKEVRSIEVEGETWYVYDYLRSFKKHEPVWIRGILPVDTSILAINTILSFVKGLLPFLVILAAIGGYWITKRAFSPIEALTDTVAQINSGNDLSQRISYQGPEDEIYKLSRSFNQMFSRLEKAFENERQFTSDASHELRTPIAVIRGACEYALSEDITAEEQKQSLEVILKQSQGMSQLVSQLLSLARADSQKAQLAFESINMSELAEMTLASLEELAEEKQIQLIGDIEEGLEMIADQTLMMRLLINLITNGMNYGKVGGWVKLELREQEGQIIGSISDNGIGIEEAHLVKIWNRFYQVDPVRSKNLNGSSGLGLALVKWIIEVHQGKIEVTSQYEVGSQFTFYLPKDRIKAVT